MRNILFVSLSLLFVGCTQAMVSDVKEAFGLGEDIDYSRCKKFEERAQDSNLPMSMREQAFKDLSQCRETVKSLHKNQ